MAIDYTTTAFIAKVRLYGRIPDTFSDADILSILNDQLQDYIVPMLLEMGEEFLVAVSDTTTTSGTAAYAIPTRSVGTKVRDVLMQGTGSAYFSLQRIEPENAVQNSGTTGIPVAYYVQNNSIVLFPTPNGALPLRIKYYRRPNSLSASGYTTITSIGATSIVIADESQLGTGGTTVVVDFIGDSIIFDAIGDNVSGFLGPNSIASTAITAMVVAGDFSVGDYVATWGNSPVLQSIPVEVYPLLVNRTVAKYLETIGDPKASFTFDQCDVAQQRIVQMLVPRTKGLSRKVVSRFGPGIGYGGGRNGWWTGST